jgi:hypothetical protein
MDRSLTPMLHKHHIVPLHDGGTDEALNLTPPIRITLHAAFHRDRWEALGQMLDFIAWKTLSGQMTASEAARASQLEGARKGGLVAGPMPKGKRSEETRKKLRESHLGFKQTAEHVEKRMSRLRGRKRPPFSAEWRANISASHVGKKWRPESIEKMRSKLIGRTYTEEQRANMSAAQLARRRRERGEA